MSRADARQFQHAQNRDADQRQRDDRQKGAGKTDARKAVAQPDRDLWPDDGGYNAADEDPGDGLGLVEGGRCVGRGKTELLDEAG